MRMSRIGLDFLSVLGMPPVDYAKLAARLGCSAIGIGAVPVVALQELYEPWTLRDNPGLMREFKAAVADLGLTVAVAEGFFVMPDKDVGIFAADLALMAEAGAGRATICSFEKDWARNVDQLGRFAELAVASGLKGAQIEFVPSMPIGDLPTALTAVRDIGRSDFGVVVDSMHIFRSGATAADVAALDPVVIGHVQICDVPTEVHAQGYGYEAGAERLCPGEGDLPLADFVAALPADTLFALEVPMRPRMLAGENVEDLMRGCVEATRTLVERVAAE